MEFSGILECANAWLLRGACTGIPVLPGRIVLFLKMKIQELLQALFALMLGIPSRKTPVMKCESQRCQFMGLYF